jgi:hypothetical protein
MRGDGENSHQVIIHLKHGGLRDRPGL